MKKMYRTDIDGMRAFAVISVILFHLGLLPNGYLGVDIFFVISGYLITGIIYNEVKENRFSIFSFYERRIRRIIPLVLFTTVSALITGIIFMSPNDLNVLSQNVLASNFSMFNIFMYITSNDYWAVSNEYNPMMHMWSLGIEEQFYLLYPFIFLILKGNKQKFIFPLLIFLTFISLALFYYSNDVSAKFYLLQYRFFELSSGGIAAIYFSKWELNKKQVKKSKIILFSMIIIIFIIIQFNIIPDNDTKIIVITFLSIGVLTIGKYHFNDNKLYKLIFSNTIISSLGKISFSLYLWHQIVFAFARYSFNLHINSIESIFLSFIIIITLSVFTYFFVENPLRNKQFIETKNVYKVVSLSFIIIVSASFYIYKINGRVKDFPQLNITKSLVPRLYNNFDIVNNSPALYNDRIKVLDKPFKKNNNLKVLIIGNSFARDFANILLETKLKESIELSYFDPWKADITTELINRTYNADYIFYSSDIPTNKIMFDILISKFKIDIYKVWVVGLKNFGINNGVYYNSTKESFGCDTIRTSIRKDIWKSNQELRLIWNDRYIDLIENIIDSKKNVPVFTKDCKFISHDTRHLTIFGALFFSDILEERLKDIIKEKNL
ncbi:Peptidoglycan/LPS O-acetylase OafA/YrhL, contains acyltransferase and SGNH-hydrolase domains [Lutibacter agarilyticus]|uniref:Peptidoglycan/LPS O-acetylase OafA/YrhL, contains acyltransferase and SGNH-hydrolase domains n=1 Tax=Lutibacter agarilyticus TaxID=1109740 RepID=A0A238YVA1_9FLAO|nr:acyltransferase [Lutibacter agarilyticus]SNR74564.1 Peptidoglycan/LPS O-acetylase OafA/YrhL, contains acyltransferase and SGNH-hydrolase domains [Lutibacter agarilyticus]